MPGKRFLSAVNDVYPDGNVNPVIGIDPSRRFNHSEDAIAQKVLDFVSPSNLTAL